MFPSFDMDGKPAASYAEIGRRFDRRYRVRERKDCEPIRMARPGDLMCFGMLRDNRLLIIIAQHDSTAEAQAK